MIKYNGKEFNEFQNTDKDNKVYNKIKLYIDDDDICIIGYYISNGNTNILFKCKKYDTYFTKTLSKFRKNNKCPYCNGFTDCTKSYQTKLDNKFGTGEYEIVDENGYTSNNTPILIKHSCGNIKKYIPYDLLNDKTKCPCSNWKWDKEKFQKLIGNDFDILDDTVDGCNNPVHIRHKICDNHIWITPNNFKNNKHNCKFCYYKSMVKNHNEFINELNRKFPGMYTVIGNYTGYDQSIEIRHNECGHIWTPTPNNILTDKSHCPKCSSKKLMSFGEDIISSSLTNLNIQFTFNAPYGECKSKNPLRFDFILDENNIIIEFDGEQHFKIASFDKYNKYEKLLERQYRDNIKTQYCIDNNLTLIRIPYTVQENLENILDKIIDGTYINEKDIYLVRDGNIINSPDIYNYIKCTAKNNLYMNALNRFNLSKSELVEYIKEIIDDVNIYENIQIGNSIPTVYIPDLKIAIHYSSLIIHNDNDHKYGRQFLTNMREDLRNNNIRLIVINDDEFIHKKDIVKSKIKHILGRCKYQNIYARKCTVKIIDSKQRREFLSKYHIQGPDIANVSLGLFYLDKLVAVMSFIKPRKALGGQTDKYDFELSRFAAITDKHVIGGFGKLLKFFKDNYEWSKIITYADLRWTDINKNIYLINGFKYLHNSSASYAYVNSNSMDPTLEFRYKYRKSELENLFPQYWNNGDSTEREIMEKAGYYRWWNCGNMVFELKK